MFLVTIIILLMILTLIIVECSCGGFEIFHLYNLVYFLHLKFGCLLLLILILIVMLLRQLWYCCMVWT